ncbi:unnamed protein product, partial [Porites evermanni]
GPSAPPVNVSARSLSSTSILVQWGEVPDTDKNGIILSYTVNYKATPEGNPQLNQIVNASTREVTLTGLIKNTEYKIEVFANTSKGGGMKSEPFTVQTDEDIVPEVTTDGAAQQFVVVGNEIQLTCHYNTSPPVSEVSWEKDGIVISTNGSVKNGSRGGITHFNDSTVQLTIVSSISSDSGDYICVINRIDNSSATASVIIQVVPSPPQNVEVIAKTSRVVNISWTPGFNGNSDILNYTVDISTDNQTFSNAACQGLSRSGCVVSSSVTNASLVGLHPGRTYYIRVFATNDVSSSTASSVITTTTDEEATTTGFPQNYCRNSILMTSHYPDLEKVPSSLNEGRIISNVDGFLKTKDITLKREKISSEWRLFSKMNFTTYHSSCYRIETRTSKNSDELRAIEKAYVVVTNTPSAAPLLSNVTALNSTSVLVEWERVPKESRNGIITKYTIYYRDELKKAEGTMVFKRPNETAIINGLRQQAEYSFWIVAATSKGNSPLSNAIKATTDAVPTILPPADDAIGAKQVSVKFVNRHALSNGSPVTYFRMIVITLPKGAESGNPAHEKYQNVTRVYDDQMDGEPYITAEFEREESRTTFTVGDGKYYSRSGITDAKRKRRAIPSDIKNLNGKLKENTEYAVFQRSFDQDENYENEGFIQFTTKKENDPESPSKSSTATIVAVVVVLVILLIVVVGIIVWRLRSPRNGMFWFIPI